MGSLSEGPCRVSTTARTLSDFATIWESAQNLEQFAWMLRNVSIPRPLALYMCPLFQSGYVVSMPEVADVVRKAAAVQVKEGRMLAKLELTSHSLPPERKTGVVVVWPQPSGSVLLIGLCPTQVWYRQVMSRLAERSSPVAKPSLTQQAMWDLLSQLDARLSGMRLRVRATSSRRWIRTSSRRRGIAARVDWEDLSVEEAFHEAASERKWYNSIEVELLRKVSVGPDVPTGITSRVHRLGFVQAYTAFPELFSQLAPLMTSIARERYMSLTGRSRMTTPEHAPRPLLIKFDEPYFRDKKNNARLIAAASGTHGFGHAVIHANPHVHMLLTDYTDGSSYELFVLEESSVLVVPQIEASPSSLDRLLAGIAVRFAEGAVADAGNIDGKA